MYIHVYQNHPVCVSNGLPHCTAEVSMGHALDGRGTRVSSLIYNHDDHESRKIAPPNFGDFEGREALPCGNCGTCLGDEKLFF